MLLLPVPSLPGCQKLLPTGLRMSYMCICTLSLALYEHKPIFAYWENWSTRWEAEMSYISSASPYWRGGGLNWECTEVEAVTWQVLKLGFESSFALWKCLLFYI